MKGKKFAVINGIVIGLLVIIFIVANVALAMTFDLITFVTNNMGINVDTSEFTNVTEEMAEEDVGIVDSITSEGMVLLRNERNTLPLRNTDRVNLFGWATTNLIVGGSGGSGGASGASVTIRDSFENAGFEVNEELLDMYAAYKSDRDKITTDEEKAYGDGPYSPYWDLPEPEIGSSYYTEKMKADAKEFSDTAVLTLGRTSGEGIDLPADYLALTQTEKDLAKYLTENYENVIVVLNSNAAMELGYLEEIDVEAIIYMPGPGKTGVRPLAKIISGEVNPSGHTVDTFAYDHESSPAYWYANRPGTMTYEEYAYEEEQTDKFFYVDYVEGIYVGYKWYETADAEGYFDDTDNAYGKGYDGVVQYPFGHGLSYTTFTQEITDVRGDLSSDVIEVDVTVTNTGKTDGKEVVQIYATAPYVKGGIEKSYVDLVGFGKTEMLKANGGSEVVTIAIDPFEIASYDWNDANDDGRTGYVLEKGDYELKVMRNAHETIDSETLSLSHDIYIENDPVTGEKIENLFDDVAGASETEPVEYLSRADFEGTYPESKENAVVGSNYGLVGRKASAAVKASVKIESDPTAGYVVHEENEQTYAQGVDNGEDTVTVADVAGKDYEDPLWKDLWDDLIDQLTVDELVGMVQHGGYSMEGIERIGLNNARYTEGPQGMNLWMGDDSSIGVNYPCETYIALTWSPAIADWQGEMFAKAAIAAEATGYMAPAVNIHRTPYCGRNFEYYAEDGYMSGVMASRVVYAARELGVIMYVKHFALNDQETHRGEYFTSLYTWCNEQAMREIYLKPFELAVKDGKAVSVMSSFNRLGATTASVSKPLLTDLLRDEWGFRGSVISDMYSGREANFGAIVIRPNEWWMDGEAGIRAGQDTYLQTMGTPQQFDTENMTTVKYLREAAKHIIYTIAASTVSPAPLSADWFWHIALPLEIVYGVLLLAYIGFYVFVLVRNRKRQKAAA